MFSTLKTKKTFPTCRNQHLDFAGENWCLIRHIHIHVSSIQNNFILFSLSRIVALCLILSSSINELKGYFCPDQIKKSSLPFRPEIFWKRCQSFYLPVEESLLEFFLAWQWQPFDIWIDTFVWHPNDLMKHSYQF